MARKDITPLSEQSEKGADQVAPPTAGLKLKVSSESRKALEDKTKELHTNVRHITQLGMTWFAFVVSMNYLAMSWLGSSGEATFWIIPLAIVFIVQDVLGIAGILSVYRAAQSKAKIAAEYEELLLKECNAQISTVGSIPICLYKRIALFLMIMLACLTLAWIGIGVYYRFKR